MIGERTGFRFLVSLLLVYVGHTIGTYFVERNHVFGYSLTSTSIMTVGVLIWMVACWVPVLGFETLDFYYSKGKLSRWWYGRKFIPRQRPPASITQQISTRDMVSSDLVKCGLSNSESDKDEMVTLAQNWYESSPPFWSLAKIALQNQILVSFVGLLFSVYITVHTHQQPPSSSDILLSASAIDKVLTSMFPDMHVSVSFLQFLQRMTLGIRSFLWTIVWVIIYTLSYDVIFYLGHRALHASRKLYEVAHKLHHTTFADRAITYHYMDFIDFMFEISLPNLIPQLIFGMNVPAWIAFLIMGTWNAIVVHSGWDLPFCPDPAEHVAHHTKYKVNYGVGVLDIACGTFDPGKQVRR